jgi:hypothetical protein
MLEPLGYRECRYITSCRYKRPRLITNVPSSPTPEASAAMERAVDRSKRASTVQFPVAFAKTADGEPPLSRLMGGGQGGEVRLKLFLTFAMQATRPPRTVPPRSAQALAALLDLPEKGGGRRVNAALNWLERERMITRITRPGRAPEVTVLNPDGSGTEWVRSSGARWITLPIEFWREGWIHRLSGRAVAVYIALRELVGGKSDPRGEYMDRYRKNQYGMSNDTWTRATKELVELGLLQVSVEMAGDDEIRFRKRNRYTLRELRSPSPE